MCRRVFNARAHTPLSSFPREGGSDVRLLCSVKCQRCFLKVPNDGSHLGVGPCVAVVTSRAVLVRVAARIWAFTIRKNFNYDHPWAVRTYPNSLITAWPVRRLGLAPKAPTRTHHTRFTSLAGPGFVAGVQNDEKINQLRVKGKYLHGDGKSPVSQLSHARDVCLFFPRWA